MNSAAISHCILVGHGDPKGIKFADHAALVSGGDLGAALARCGGEQDTPKTFISLSCLTGRAAFGNGFSATKVCRQFVGPFQSIHGAVASQYLQTLLARHLLDPADFIASHRKANEAASRGSHFKLYRDGAAVQPPPGT